MEYRITLVPMETPEDFPLFARLAFHETVMGMNMGRIFTREEAEGYFAHILSYRKGHPHSGTHKILKTDDGTFLGTASLWEDETEAEVDYMLLPEFWGQGYATEAVKKLEEIAEKLPQIAILKGIIDPDNLPSQRVLLKNGFALTREEILKDGSTVQIYTKTSKGKE